MDGLSRALLIILSAVLAWALLIGVGFVGGEAVSAIGRGLTRVDRALSGQLASHRPIPLLSPLLYCLAK